MEHKAAHMAAPQSSINEVSVQSKPIPRVLAAVFLFVCGGFLLAVLALTPAFGGAVSAEKTDDTALPQLIEEGRVNPQFLSQLGDWFSQNFAFRSQLVDADATIKERLFMTSPIDQVIVGTDGWLYYGGELNDWRGATPMTDGAIANAAYNLRLIQDALAVRGKGFAVAIAPNKSTLYPEHMPAWYVKHEGTSNAERISQALQEREVCYVNLFDVLHSAQAAQSEPLYLKRDSHWTDVGAGYAAQAILDELGHAHEDWQQEDAGNSAYREGSVGDLDDMLHPTSALPEPQQDVTAFQSFSWTGEATSVEDSNSDTAGPSGSQGSLLMLRDSFGNALLPWMAHVYVTAHFSKLVPYNLSDAQLASVDDVVIERAERHISSFASEPPYLSAPELATPLVVRGDGASDGSSSDASSAFNVVKNGPYLQVEGVLDEAICPAGTSVYLSFELADGSYQSYHCFRLSSSSESYQDRSSDDLQSEFIFEGDGGFRAFVPLERLSSAEPRRLVVCMYTTEGPVALAEQSIDWSLVD
ncbi:MAG: hypothetical protein IJ125_00205 [Atopobiaceae bacterium]|nr:hypothetical protein [Atopobiaceae bacterium]